jgi:hypothetical protein
LDIFKKKKKIKRKQHLRFFADVSALPSSGGLSQVTPVPNELSLVQIPRLGTRNSQGKILTSLGFKLEYYLVGPL